MHGAGSKRFGGMLCIAFAIAAPPATAIELTINPESPREFEPISAVVELPACRLVDAVEHVGGRIRIVIEHEVCGVPPPGTYPTEVSIGRLPAGDYAVDVVELDASASEPALGSIDITVRRSALEAAPRFPDEPHGGRLDISGSWWDPDRPGHGVFIEHSTDGAAFVVLNTYDAEGAAIFRIMPLRFIDRGQSRFPLEGPLLRVDVIDGQPMTTQLGEASLQPSGIGTLTLTLVQAGQSENIELRRISF